MERRIAGAVGVVAALLSITSFAHADERAECAKAYEQAQRLSQQEQVMKAVEAAQRCSRNTCPALLSSECREWTQQWRARLARVVLDVKGADACAARDYRVEIDRVKRTESGDLLVDPGVHEIRVVDPASGNTKDDTVDLAAGSRRTLSFDFAPPGAQCAGASSEASTKTPSSVPTPAIVLWVAGGVMLATGITVGLVGAGKRGDLDDCRPSCSRERLDDTQLFFTVGDIVGGIGIASLAAGALVYFLVKNDVQPRGTTTGLTPNGFSVRF
jgi:hypothetical protein